MASKDELKQTILDIEPDNAVANEPRSSHGQLAAELVQVRTRAIERSNTPTIPGTIKYRVEDNGFSWRIEADDFLGDLSSGPTLPPIGTRVLNDEGEPVEVTEHESGLTIRAGDLEKREGFDPRRIYVTKSGNDVVFKRIDTGSGKPILWSFRQNMEIIVGPNTELTRTDRSAKPTASSGRQMNQKNLAAYLIAKSPSITGSELTALLREAFPLARVNDRHGPHYLSLSRNGKLPEASEDDPRTWVR